MDVTKPYEFIGFGAMDATKPYKFIGFGPVDEQSPNKPNWEPCVWKPSGGARKRISRVNFP